MNSKILTLFLLFTLIASGLTVVIVTDEGSDGASVVGDTFTADTSDTVPVTVTYKITSLDPATVQVGNGTQPIVTTYAFATPCTIPASVTNDSITYSVTAIGEGAFAGNADLTDVFIPDSVTVIGDGAFYHCTGLTKIVIPGSVVSIGGGVFNGCTYLTITILPGITSIGEGKFYGCTGLIKIVIPDTVTSIGAGAFDGCTSLTSVIIQNTEGSVTIGEEAIPATATVAYVPVSDLVTYTLSFNGDGVAIDSQTVTEGSAGIVPAAPTKDGYTFVGWFQSDLTTEFDFTEVLTANTTAYAVWSSADVPSDPGLDTSALVCIAIGIVGLICLASCLFRFDWIVLVIGIVLIIVACVIYGSTHQITLPW